MTLSVTVTRRDRRRKLRSGERVVNSRFVVNLSDPDRGLRRQLFFEKKADAIAKRDEFIADYRMGTLATATKARSLTVKAAVEHWLANRSGEIRARTLGTYMEVARYITEPLLLGTAQSRLQYTRASRKPKEARFLPTLGHLRVHELSTADIRAWHKTLWTEVGAYSANRAKMCLRTALALAAEDFGVRPPPMPTQLGRGRPKLKKAILSPEQVALVLRAAQTDQERGIYYAFPFLTGTRPSEQLALLWRDVDFETNTIRICRAQDLKGGVVESTKTAAGTREVPTCPLLRKMLLEWRVRCPRLTGELYRVFPNPGRVEAWPKPRIGGGSALLYSNFRRRFWVPALKKLALPAVTPHSARHTFISTLQAQGIEVGLVAKLAGHANANVTLGHYTQAMRGGEGAVEALERAYGGVS